MVVWYQSGRKSGVAVGGWVGHVHFFYFFYFLQWWPHKWWVGHFLVHVRSQRTVPNSPPGHSLYCPKLVTLYYVTRFMRWSRALWGALSHLIGEFPLKKPLIPFSTYSTFFIQSLAFNQLHKFVRHRRYLATAWYCTMQLGKKEISVLFSFILTSFYQDEIILCYLNFCCLHQFIAFWTFAKSDLK